MAKEPRFLKPRLRLFLSADIVGSTALKQTPRDPVTSSTVEWFPILQGFYIETQRAFLGGWARAQPADVKECNIHWGPKPEFWKVIGDEILFTKELTDSHQLVNTIACWIDAVELTRAYIRNVDPRLDVKCTAWTAGFPLVNKEVALPRAVDPSDPPVTNYFQEAGRLLDQRYRRGGDSKVAVDYIGPSIDIGFRICQFASARKFILSVGAAYILSMSNKTSIGGKPIPFRYDGAHILKGVFGGAKYPLFWIDLAKPGDLSVLEDALTNPIRCKSDDVHAFCAKFFEETNPYTFEPFVSSSTEQELVKRPDYYTEALLALRNSYALEIIGDEASEKAAEAEEPPAGATIPADLPPKENIASADADTPLSVQTLNFDRLIKAVIEAEKSRLASATQDGSSRASRRAPVGKAKEDDGRKEDT